MKRYRWTAASVLFTIVSLLFATSQSGVSGQSTQPAYKNTSLSIDKRVDDLVSRMTLEEKVSQMMNAAASVDRLDIPQYEWWNEALHGVARAGYATVFPQAIGHGRNLGCRSDASGRRCYLHRSPSQT